MCTWLRGSDEMSRHQREAGKRWLCDFRVDSEGGLQHEDRGQLERHRVVAIWLRWVPQRLKGPV